MDGYICRSMGLVMDRWIYMYDQSLKSSRADP